MSEWFYSQFGQTKGPTTTADIVDKVLHHELELDSYVMNGKNEQWIKIKDIPELMDALHKPEDIPHNVKFPNDLMGEGFQVRAGNIYYYVPIAQMLLYNVISLGLYQFYWFYKQWYYWATNHKKTYLSPDRELSWILFPWTMFEKIETDKELNAVERADFNGTLIFWMWAFSGFFLFMLMQFSRPIHGLSNVIYYLGGVAEIAFLIPIQRYINRVNAKLGNRPDKFGCGMIIVLAAGLALILYALSVKQIVGMLVF